MSGNALEKLLELIDTEMAREMLNDLRTPERRTPQLYNAISKFLDRHQFSIKRLEVNAEDLGELQAALDDFKTFSDDEMFGDDGVVH